MAASTAGIPDWRVQRSVPPPRDCPWPPTGRRAGNLGLIRQPIARLLTLVCLALVLGSGCGSPSTPQKAGPTSASAPSAGAYAQIGPLRIYYEVHGQGPPLVLLHGGGSDISTTFGRILPELAKHYRVIAVDQQGHGHTADIDRPFTFEQMADDTSTLMDRLGVSSADIFGFSNGGQVAIRLALRHPERVHKLVLASTIYRHEGMTPELRASFSRSVRPADMPPALRAQYLHVAPHPEALQTQIDKTMRMLREFRDLSDADLRRITAPTLIMIGDQDVVRLEHAVHMMRVMPHARLVVLPSPHGGYIGEASTPSLPGRVQEFSVALVNEFLAARTPVAPRDADHQ